MTTALITPAVLSWARQRAQMEPDRLAEKTGVNINKVLLWEQGEAKPTFRQAQAVARVLHVPFGFLFLSQPPEEDLPIPDLRTVGSNPAHQLSVDVRDVITDVLYKQDWYRDSLLGQGAESLPFLGRFDDNSSAADIARDMVEILRLTIADRQSNNNQATFLDLLVERAENAGLWIMRSGIVGTNTHRPLSVEEFRGFAIFDDFVPVVFINGKDAKAAQIFTLVHELAHLWIGQSGISNLPLNMPINDSHQEGEKLCNAVAAEVLVPERVLREQWNMSMVAERNAELLSSHFHVSSVVIARRAFDLELITWPAYNTYYQAQAERWEHESKSRKPGGQYYFNPPIRNGRRFTKAVLQNALSNRLLLRDAGALLNINPSKIFKLAKEIGVA